MASRGNSSPEEQKSRPYARVSLRLRLVSPLVGFLAVVFLAISTFFPKHYRESLLVAYTREASATAKLFAVAVANALNEHSFDLLQKTMQSARNDPNVLFIEVVDLRGEKIADYDAGQAAAGGDSARTVAEYASSSDVLLVDSDVAGEFADTSGRLTLGFSLSRLNRDVARVRGSLLVLTLGLFCLSAFLVFIISTRVTRSLFRLRQQMQKTILEDAFDSALPVTSSDEVGGLTTVFNEMMQVLLDRHLKLTRSRRRFRQLYKKNQNLNRLQSNFVSDASHQLRTPLTVILGEVEIALGKERTNESYRETLQIVHEQVAHLARIVERLLVLAQADAGKLVTTKKSLDLGDLCRFQAEQAERLARLNGVSFDADVVATCPVRGDPGRLSDLVSNLLVNAVKYTPEGGRVSLCLRRENGRARMKVTDSGVGIPRDELNRIFHRFFRGAKSASGPQGTGLGLALCKLIAKEHGGEIKVRSTPGVGSVFEVLLPVRQE